MMAEKILGRQPVPLGLVKEMVKERTKEMDAPTYEQDMTLKYVEKFSSLSRAKAEKLVEDLQKIEGVDNWLAVKLADLLPADKVVVELLIAKRYTLNEEAIQGIMDTLKKYSKS